MGRANPHKRRDTNAVASGTVQVLCECKVLLNCMTPEADEQDEKQGTEHNERAKLDKWLRAAVKAMRRLALNCRKRK